MKDTQKIELVKNKQDVIMDLASGVIGVTLMYFIVNPGAYDRVTEAVSNAYDAINHRLSIWQAKLSIRSLPETDKS